MTTNFDPAEFIKITRLDFQKASDEELVKCFNRQLGNPGWGTARSIYISELRKEFHNRKWDYSVITNDSGGFKLAKGNDVSLMDKKLILIHN